MEAVQDTIAALPKTIDPDDADCEAQLGATKKRYVPLIDHEKPLVFYKLEEKLEHLDTVNYLHLVIACSALIYPSLC